MSLLLQLPVWTILLLARHANSVVYSVGPTQAYTSISQVPLNALQAGDEVLIYAKSTPYYEKFVLNAVGTEQAPIVIRGIPDAQGNKPIIDGNGATTPLSQDFWNEKRGLIKVGGSSVPSTPNGPTFIRIEGLHLRNAHKDYSFTTDNGGSDTYSNNAACVFVEQGFNLEIVSNEITGCGNGIFIASNSGNIVVERNYIHGNGNVGRFYEHNAYTESKGLTYRFNRFGPLCDGCGGNNLKDRSAGLVVAYNYIEGGNRQLDLVDSSKSSIYNDPTYSTTLVYGNILVEPDEFEGNRQIIHYGGDSGSTFRYRKGTLHLYHNTVASFRTGRTTLLRLSSDDEDCDARNNIVYVSANGSELELLADNLGGSLTMDYTWFKPGFTVSFANSNSNKATLTNTVTGTDPGFQDIANWDFRLANSLLPSATLAPGVPPVDEEYVVHLMSQGRTGADLGAFGHSMCTPNQILVTIGVGGGSTVNYCCGDGTGSFAEGSSFSYSDCSTP